MIDNLKTLNEASGSEAQAWFRNHILESSVCDDWIEPTMQKRPFSSVPQLLSTAEASWRGLSETQRIEMMNGHPEIGKAESTAGDPEGMEAAEQRGMADASPELSEQIDADKSLYRKRFGFIYMIFATGKSATELAQALSDRLRNTREKELATATTEFWRINRKRMMDKLGSVE